MGIRFIIVITIIIFKSFWGTAASAKAFHGPAPSALNCPAFKSFALSFKNKPATSFR
jgi:hypothetical protein